MKDYITFCKDIDNNYKVIIASEQLGTIYKNKEAYSKKDWLKDLEDNGYMEIKTIIEDYRS
ncbi:hypothetical protein ACGCUP_01075 [Eubacteriales bacterium KG125]